MARRSAVGHGRGTAVAEEAPAPGRALGSAVDPWEPPEQTGRRGRSGGGKGGGGRWSGSGGRWWVGVGRAVLWALILVILVNGIRAPFERFTADDAAAPSGPAKPGKSAQFPASAAGAFALQFANVYLNYDQKNAPARAEQLRTFLPDGADAQFGWNSVGQLQMQSVQVAGVDARDADNATVTLLARSADKWFRLAVPVYARNGSLVISGRPALLPPPTKAALPQSGVRDRDTALEGELQPFLGTFFQAYAHGDQTVLSRFSDGTAIGGLADSVTFVKVAEVIAPKGPAGERTVTAAVAWQVPGSAAAGNGGELGQTYQLEMVKKGATWYVRDIRGTTEPSAS